MIILTLRVYKNTDNHQDYDSRYKSIIVTGNTFEEVGKKIDTFKNTLVNETISDISIEDSTTIL